MFFVLSGFLITGVLLDGRERKGFFRSFFLRRAARTCPLYYASLMVLLAALWFGASQKNGAAELLSGAGWYWTYLQNFWIAWRNAWPGSGILDHFWSLAVEWQFYVLWPFVIWFLPFRYLGRTVAAVAGLALAYRVACLSHGGGGVALYVHTFARADALALGSLACLLSRSVATVFLSRMAGWVVAVSGACLAVLFGLRGGLNPYDPWMQSGGYSLSAVFFSGVVLLLVQPSACNLGQRALSWLPLRRLGVISYGVYVFHCPVLKCAHAVAEGMGATSKAMLTAYSASAVSLIILMAALSWRFFEEPVLKAARRVASRNQP
jgi:peptidoglycan/LPS O-acetylase OafA/YrhL